MNLPTYHSHTFYCDGEGSPEDYIRQAIDQGLPAYGFSSHAPVPFPNDWSMKKELVEEYMEEIEILRGSYSQLIEIYTGLEADFIPGKTDPLTVKNEYKLDYVIGSIHYVKQFNSGVPWQIDGNPEDFERGYNEIFNRNAQALITEYYELTRQMIREGRPDILGHLDKIKMHNKSFRLFNEDDNWYQQEVLATLEEAKKAAVIIEVNTRGIYKKGMSEPYPGRWALEKIREMDIPVMLNSDAHHPSEITASYAEALSIMKAAGIRKVMVIKNNQFELTDID